MEGGRLTLAVTAPKTPGTYYLIDGWGGQDKPDQSQGNERDGNNRQNRGEDEPHHHHAADQEGKGNQSQERLVGGQRRGETDQTAGCQVEPMKLLVGTNGDDEDGQTDEGDDSKVVARNIVVDARLEQVVQGRK